MIASAIVAALALATASEQGSSARIGAVRAQLWYEESGRLSNNIAPPASPTLWNTPIGEGDAQESANDMLVTVEVLARGRQNVETPLRIEVRGRGGRMLAQRQVPSMLTSEQGRTVQALWVPNVGCAGPVQVTARLGRLSRSARIDFNCGE